MPMVGFRVEGRFGPNWCLEMRFRNGKDERILLLVRKPCHADIGFVSEAMPAMRRRPLSLKVKQAT